MMSFQIQHMACGAQTECQALIKDFIFVSEYLKLLDTDNGKLAQSR